MWPRWRFSLRFLLIATAVLPLAAYWLALPTLNAQRYAAAINSGNYATADKLCVDPKQAFPGDWTRHKTFQPTAGIKVFDWRDVLKGRRDIYVMISYGDGSGIASCGVQCVAKRGGIEVGMFMP
jgi:hypothetical protein